MPLVRKSRSFALLTALATLLTVFALPAGRAFAAEIAIDCSVDDLQATIDAPTTMAGDTIIIADGTSCLGNFTVSKPLTISSVSTPAEGGAEINGGDVNAGPTVTIFTGGTVILENLTITGGRNEAPNTGLGGGLLITAGSVMLTDSVIFGNTAVNGGGIYNNGELTVVGGEVFGNTASGAGGGVFSNGTATLSGVAVGGTDSGTKTNTAGDGGGVYNTGDMTIDSLTVISGNASTAPAGGGGGIWSDGALTVTDSTVNQNAAADAGGGIHNTSGGALTVSSSEVSNNTAAAAGGILNNGAANTGSTATLTDVTVDGNTATDPSGLGGGGIYNFSFQSDTVKANLVLRDSRVTNNTSGPSGAGGIRNQDALATVINTLVLGNSTTGAGGGIRTSGTMGVTDSTISTNVADTSGGGITVDGSGSLLTVNRSSIDLNDAGGEGGGIAVGVSTFLNAARSSITRNSAYAAAGLSNAGNATVTNSTVSGNVSETQGGGVLTSGTLTVTNATITANSALLEGGGVRVIGTPSVTLTGTIVYSNIAASGGDCSGPVSGGGFNLMGVTALPCLYTGDPTDAPALSDPLLGALGFYAGATEHHPLMEGSDAIDAGGACGLATDQIGTVRPDGPACDIGAIEGESVAQPVVGDQVVLVEPNGRWHIRRPGLPDYTFIYGNPGDVPLFGDWDGDGFDTPGMWRQGAGGGFAYMTNTLPANNSVAVAEFDFFFGAPGDEVFSGDWNGDGTDTLGINRSGNIFLTDTNGSGGLPVPTDYDFFFGNPGDRAFGGDGDGDGSDSVFLYRDIDGFVYWTDETPTGPSAVASTTDNYFFGIPSDSFVAGDWNDDLVDTAAIFRGSNTTVYWTNTNGSGGAPAPTDGFLVWGTAGWTPVAGVPELP